MFKSDQELWDIHCFTHLSTPLIKKSHGLVVLRVMINSTTNGGRHRSISRITSHGDFNKNRPRYTMLCIYKTVSVETKQAGENSGQQITHQAVVSTTK
jgi:hypothetical protein